MRGTIIPSGHATGRCSFAAANEAGSAAPRRVLSLLALILVILDINTKKIDVFGEIMAEKYIFCPDCMTLTVHERTTGEIIGWLCSQCNPSLEEWL